MKKSIFIALLIFSMFLNASDAYARKAKKPNPIKAPVVIQTDENGNITTQKPEEKREDAPIVNSEELNDAEEASENTSKEEEIKIAEPKEEEIKAAEPNEVEVSDKKTEKVEVVAPDELQTQNTVPLPANKAEINPCNAEVETFFQNFEVLQNKHNLKELRKVYTDDFVNSDGYNKDQLFALMTRTFAGYPDLKTEFEIKEIVSNKKFAMATIVQNITATTKETSKITKDKGTYSAQLENVFYLKKVGKDWKIYSEAVLRETSKLAYGMAKDVDAVVAAPQKVLSGSDYGAGVKVFLPDGYSAIASVNNTQVVENYNMTGDSFRQVPADISVVERVLKANSDNNNEAVVISVGFTKLSQDMFKKAKMDISGLMILMQRVDVVPKNSNLTVDNERSKAKK